jgi:hypothetical protein
VPIVGEGHDPSFGMPDRTHLARIAIGLLVVVVGAVAAPLGVSSAAAATYDVDSCTSNADTLAPISGADDAWTPDPASDVTHFEFIKHCPPAAGLDRDGLLLEDHLLTAAAPSGNFAQWRFDAPAGTTVTRLRLRREIGKQENTWELYTRAADGTRLGGTTGPSLNDSDCVVDPDSFTCQVGFPGSAGADWTGLNTTGVRVGIRCVAASCATGATLHEAWTAIYGAIVTVDDPTAPTAAGTAGSLLTDAYVHGGETATLNSASDATGIRAVQVIEGGTLLAESQRTCDFSRRVPCTNLTAPASVTVATTGMPDGQHTIHVGATDAAGNFTAATSQQVTVDNTAPAAPTPTSPTSQTVSASSATVSWQAPDGQVAPISAAHITLCSPSDVCQSTTQAAGPARGSASLSLTSGYGVYRVLVSLEDAAGNTDPNELASYQVVFPSASTMTRSQPTSTPAAAPTPAPGPSLVPTSAPMPKPLASPRLALHVPTVGRDRRTIAVKGTVAPDTTGRITVKVTVRIRGRTRTVTRSATIRSTRYSVHLKLPSSAWKTAKVTARFPGSSTRVAATVTRTLRQRSR